MIIYYHLIFVNLKEILNGIGLSLKLSTAVAYRYMMYVNLYNKWWYNDTCINNSILIRSLQEIAHCNDASIKKIEHHGKTHPSGVRYALH